MHGMCPVPWRCDSFILYDVLKLLLLSYSYCKKLVSLAIGTLIRELLSVAHAQESMFIFTP